MVKATTEPHNHQGGFFGPGSFYAVSMPWRMLHAELTNREDSDIFSGATPLILENECVECWQKMAQVLIGIIIQPCDDDPEYRADLLSGVEQMVAHYIALGEKLEAHQ